MTLYAAHTGYVFQDLAVACFLIESLVNNYDQITIDKKQSAPDDFDDLSIKQGDTWIRRQFKHSTSHTFSLNDLRLGGRIELHRLIKSHKLNPLKDNSIYQLCLAWEIPDACDAFDVLDSCDSTHTLPLPSLKTFQVSPLKIWPENSESIWDELNCPDYTKDDFLDLCSRLTIQLSWPKASLDLQAPSELENILSYLLENRVGIGRYPNQSRSLLDVSSLVVRLATNCRAQGKTLNTAEIEHQLGIRTDFGKISQKFPINNSSYIHRSGVHDAIKDHLTSNQVSIITGPPGSGKSWLVTKIIEDLHKSNYIVSKHYCYLEPGDPHIQNRITENVLFGNIIADIVEAVPEIRSSKKAIYAADSDELELILQKADELSNVELFLVVDGLDHIDRISAEAPALSLDEIGIISQLAYLDLPKSVHLIISSQPGEHLADILDKFKGIEPVIIPNWELPDFQAYIRIQNLDVELKKAYGDDSDELINNLFEISSGNPLYSTFLTKDIYTKLFEGEAFDIQEYINNLPRLSDDISNYYSFLLKATDDIFFQTVAYLLGFIDFSLSIKDLSEIYPQFSSQINKAINRLSPILLELSGQGGIRIYHESFRRYIVSKMQEDGRTPREILSPAIDWLIQLGFLDDAKSYRFLLFLYRRIGDYESIKNLLSSTFVIDSVAAFHPRASIESNLAVAAEAAAEVYDWPFLAHLGELYRALYTCFEDKLADISFFGETYGSIFGYKALKDRLLFDGKRTYSIRDGLLLCSLIDNNGIVPPWDEYLSEEIEELNIAPQNNSEEYEIQAARFHGLIRINGVEDMYQRFEQWLIDISDNIDQYYLSLLLNRIQQFGDSFLSKLMEHDELPLSTKRFIRIKCIDNLIKENKPEAAKELLDKYKADINAYEALEYLSDGLDITLTDIPVLDFREFDISISNDSYSVEAGQIDGWQIYIRLSAYMENNSLGQEIEHVAGRGWYRGWLVFLIKLAKAEARAWQYPNEAENEILDALEELTGYNQPFAGKPRTCDLYSINHICIDSFRRTLRLIRQRDGWIRALNALASISSSTTTYLSNSPGGPLRRDALMDMLLEYASDTNISDLIENTLLDLLKMAERSGEYYELHAEYEMKTALLYAKTRKIKEAKDHWKMTAQYLTSYGYRKDTTIYELLDPIPSIGRMSRPLALKHLSKSQSLSDCVLDHTDGRGTNHVQVSWFSKLLDVDISLASRLLSQSLLRYGGDIDWRLEDSFSNLLLKLYKRVPSDLYLDLQFTLPLNYDNYYEGRAYGERIDLMLKSIQDLLDNGNSEIAHRYFSKFCSHAIDDAQKIHHSAYEMIKGFADLNGLEFIMTRELDKTEDSNKYNKKYFPKDTIEGRFNWPWFGKDATPNQVLAVLRKTDIGHKGGDKHVNALGYRMLEMVEQDMKDQVLILIDAYAKHIYYENQDALNSLAEGFIRFGHKDIASHCYSNAFVYGRGGGGWKSLGDEKHHKYFRKALDIDHNTPLLKLSTALSKFIKGGGYFIGTTSNLIELFVYLNESKIVEDIWSAAYNIISIRLPDYSSSHGPFLPLDAIEQPDDTVSAVIELLISRISHPEYRRKLSGIVSLKNVMDTYQKECSRALKKALSFMTPASSVVHILSLIFLQESTSDQIIDDLSTELIGYSCCNHYSLRALSKQLLSRRQISTPIAASLIPKTPQLARLPDKNMTDSIINLFDSNDRLKKISETVPNFIDAVIQQFEYLYACDTLKEFARSRHRSSSNRSTIPVILSWWEEELLELAVNETAFMLIEDAWKLGQWDKNTEYQILHMLNVDLKLSIAFMGSRVHRPRIEKIYESNYLDSNIPKLNEGIYKGWKQLAFYEVEYSSKHSFLDINCRYKSFSNTLFSSFHNDLRNQFPFTGGNYFDWFAIEETDKTYDMLNFSGPVAGLDLYEFGRFIMPVLMLPSQISNRLGLRLDKGNALKLNDTNGDVAVVFHWWWSSPFGDSFSEEVPKYFGSRLLVRPDILNKLRSFTVHPPSYLTTTIINHFGNDN